MASVDWKSAAGWLQGVAQPATIARAASATAILLVVVVAYQAALMTWRLFPPLEQAVFVPERDTTNARGQVTAQPTARLDIAKWHLFGNASEEAPVVARQEPIRETPLRLELRGVLASDDPNTARAIIADESRQENFYAIESPLPGGAILKEIHSDHIILSRNNRLETLRLPKESLDSMVEPASSGATPSSGSASPSPSLGPAASLGDFKQALLNDPQSLMGLLQAQPAMDGNGQVYGYTLGDNQDPRTLSRFGLRRGDVVTAVNGIVLDGPTKLPQLLASLREADQVRIEYQRRGQPRSIVLNMND